MLGVRIFVWRLDRFPTAHAPARDHGLRGHGDTSQYVRFLFFGAEAPEAAAAKLAQELSSQRYVDVQYTVIPGADHFFTDKLDAVAAAIDGYVAPRPAGPGATET